MEPNSIINGDMKMSPLISFYSIVDTDIGLIRMIKDQYLNQSVFDIDFFKRNILNIIYDLYNRKEENPLLLFANDKSNEKLNQYYIDFLNEKSKEILDLSYTTDMERLVNLFEDSSEIIPTILCYDKDQIDVLNDTDLYKNIDKVLLSELLEKDKYRYTQYYFKTIDEAEPFLNAKAKTIYFSTCGRNLNEDYNDFRESDIIDTLVARNNQINLITLYQKDIRKEIE